MSSGVEADIIVGAAIAAGLGALTALGGTALAGGYALDGLAALAGAGADRLQRVADRRAAAIEQAARDAELLRDVLDRNARIDVMTHSRTRLKEQYGAEIPVIPEPLTYTGQSADELTAWCERVDAELAAAEQRLAADIAGAMTIRATTSAALVTDLGLAAEPASGSADDRDDTAETLVRVLARLHPQAAPPDRAAVLAAAVRVGTAPTTGEAAARLTDVRIRIQTANASARTALDGAITAARLLRGLTGHDGAESVRARLADVVAGRQELDEKLHREAERLLGEATAEMERRYVADAVTDALTDMGYEVGEGFETLTVHDGEAYVRRAGWPQHAVKMRIDDGRRLRLAMIRTAPPASEQERRLDAERERDWCDSFAQVRDKLATAGLHTDVTWQVEPGQHRLPVLPRGQDRTRTRTRYREREL